MVRSYSLKTSEASSTCNALEALLQVPDRKQNYLGQLDSITPPDQEPASHEMSKNHMGKKLQIKTPTEEFAHRFAPSGASSAGNENMLTLQPQKERRG